MHLVTTILVPILLSGGPINFLKQGPTGKAPGFPAGQSAPATDKVLVYCAMHLLGCLLPSFRSCVCTYCAYPHTDGQVELTVWHINHHSSSVRRPGLTYFGGPGWYGDLPSPSLPSSPSPCTEGPGDTRHHWKNFEIANARRLVLE